MGYEYKSFENLDPFFDTTVKQRVLEFLRNNKGSAYSTKEISEALKIPTASVNRALNELESIHFLESSEDGRFKRFSITPSIRKEVDQVYAHMQSLRKFYLEQNAKLRKKEGEVHGNKDN